MTTSPPRLPVPAIRRALRLAADLLNPRSVPKLSLGWRYLIPPAATLAVYFVQLLLLPRTAIAPFVFFYVGVALSALLGGRAPGLLAVALSAGVANYAFIDAPLGSTSIAELTATALFVVAASVVALLCAAFRDAAMRAQQAAEDLARQSSVLALSHDAIVVWRPDTGIEAWNRGAEQMYGFTREEARGRSPAELLHTRFPRDWSAIAAQLREQHRWEGELVHTAKDGRSVVVDARLQYLPGSDGIDRILESNRDISERARSGDELLQKEQRLRAVFENVSLGIAEVDATGRVENVNQRLCDMLGYRGDELVGMSIDELTLPADRELTRHLDRKLARGELDRIDFEKRFLQKGAVPLWAHVTVCAVRDSAGHFLRGVGTVEDISERRRIEEELGRERALLQGIYDNIPVLLVLWDPHLKRFMLNRHAEAVLGWSTTEANEGDLMSRVYPDADYRARVGSYMQSLQPGFHEWVVTTKAGAQVPIEWANVRLSDETAIGIGVDLRERKSAEQALRRALQDAEERGRLLDAMMEHIPMGITIADAPDVTVRQVSRFGRELLEQTSDELTGSPAEVHLFRADGVTPARPEERPLTRATSKGELVRGEEWVVARKDGAKIPILCTAAPIRDGAGGVTGGVIGWQDISERRRAEEALRRANEQLLESDRRKNEFLAVLSHELRNPLAPIRNSVYILGRATPGGEQSRHALAVIERQVAQMARLIDDLLDVTRISRGKIRLQREALLLNDLVRGVGDDFREQFRRQGTELEVRVPEQPLRAFVDRTRIAQVVGNLLGNAAKFTPSSGRVTLSLAPDDHGQALIEVRDNGAGIEAGVLGKLFEPFVQAQTTLDRTKGGLGLGLALVRGLVELHGGAVSARSEGPGTGAEFKVRLPLEKATAPERQVALRPRPSLAGKLLRVLLIEDNVDAAESLKEALELNGHEVETAATGLEGIEKGRTFRPDVVLCDIGLPGIDGFEVARRMREDPSLRAARLVALSGYAAPEDLERSREAGFVQHLAKPPDLDVLEHTILEACAERRSAEAPQEM